jgi:hypothetical protein
LTTGLSWQKLNTPFIAARLVSIVGIPRGANGERRISPATPLRIAAGVSSAEPGGVALAVVGCRAMVLGLKVTI